MLNMESEALATLNLALFPVTNFDLPLGYGGTPISQLS